MSGSSGWHSFLSMPNLDFLEITNNKKMNTYTNKNMEKEGFRTYRISIYLHTYLHTYILTYIHRILPTKNRISFLSTTEYFLQNRSLLVHKPCLNKYKKNQNHPMHTNQICTKKLEITDKRNHGKCRST